MKVLGPQWRVRRSAGLLVPGFTKRFDERCSTGVTYLLGLPIGRFDVHRPDDRAGVELRYRRWPVVDVLHAAPRDRSVPAAGFLRLPGGRRQRFCRFVLEP